MLSTGDITDHIYHSTRSNLHLDAPPRLTDSTNRIRGDVQAWEKQMPTRRVLAALVATAALLATTAYADDTSTLDRIEVTGSRISYNDLQPGHFMRGRG